MKGQWSFFTSYLLNALQRTKLGWNTLESDAEGGFKKHLGRSNISSEELLVHVCHSLTMMLQNVAWFGWVLQVLPNKILLYRFAGCAHWNGPESYSKPTFATEGKGQPSGCPSAGQQNRAELHICFSKHLAHCFRTDLALQGREATPWSRQRPSNRTTLVRSGTTGAHKDLSIGHLVLAVVIKLKSPFKGWSVHSTRLDPVHQGQAGS